MIRFEEQWIESLIDERTRALAEPVAPERPSGTHLLVCAGRETLWGLPVAAVRRVALLPPWAALPGRRGAVMGLALVAGQRVLLADLDALVTRSPPRSAGQWGERPGHVVVLREDNVALVVDRALSVTFLEVREAPLNSLGWGMAKGKEGELEHQDCVVLDAGALAALVQAQAGSGRTSTGGS